MPSSFTENYLTDVLSPVTTHAPQDRNKRARACRKGCLWEEDIDYVTQNHRLNVKVRMSEQRKSLAKPNTPPEPTYSTPEEKPAQEQEKSKSKSTLFFTGVDVARRF